MAKQQGIDFIVSVNTGTDAVPVWTKVGGQRGATLNRSADTLDSTSKDSNGWKENEYSFKEWGIESEGLLLDSDVGYSELEDAFMNAVKVKIQMVTASGKKYEGMSLVTDFPIEAPYDDLATYSVTFTGDRELSIVPAV
ncbi:phage tail tube protein [Fictibacillus sp. 26RED30]|uniref:phage tail tube protein n=1 Tax=Fictibacillus sp. 26RED30 TaxID=2745877 RepID=UPI0018CE2F42|nr:phage major tail protein, TP901-1 family [Fictibacillus sp. 26RED30]MBH0159884.1 phage major tail protein, TP901-1 family [Fictibacillus sp. 26RED30]